MAKKKQKSRCLTIIIERNDLHQEQKRKDRISVEEGPINEAMTIAKRVGQRR